MEKLKCSFPTSCKQSYPQFQKTASYTHSHKSKLIYNSNFSENGLIIGDSCRKKFGFHFTKCNAPIITKWEKHCYLSLFQPIYLHFWQEKTKTKSKLFYQKMPWIKDLQRKVWISSKFWFVGKSKSLDFPTMPATAKPLSLYQIKS